MELNTNSESLEPSVETKEKISFWKIDRNLIRFKVHYFLFSGGMACITPYLPVIARNKLGLSASALAVAVTTQQFITVLSRIVIGYIADYFNKLKLIIVTLTVLHSIFYILLILIPPIKPLSLKPVITRELFKNCNFEKETEFLIITSRPLLYCQNISLGDDALTSYFTSNKSMHYKNKNNYNLACSEQFNHTALFCLQNQLNEQNNSQIIQTFINCSSSGMLPKLDLVVQPDSANKYDFLSLLATSLSRELVNSTLHCIITFSKDKESPIIEIPNISEFETSTFWKFVALDVAVGICYSSLFTLADTACCESLQKFGGEFGRQRVFGAIGWGILAPIGGYVCDLTSDYIFAWVLMTFLQALVLCNIYKLDLIKPHFSKNLFKDVRSVLKSRDFLMFDLATFLTGFGAGIVWFYLVWFIFSLGGSGFLCGLMVYVQCFAGELPFMFFSGWMIKKMGHFNLMSLALLCFAIRFMWYSYLQNPWLVLPMEVVHGITYGTLYPTVASFGKLSAKPGTEATTQSILFTTHEGIGAGIGCVVAGVSFDHLGGHWTFFYASLISFFALILNLTITFFVKKRQSKVQG